MNLHKGPDTDVSLGITREEFHDLVGYLGGWIENGNVYFLDEERHHDLKRLCAERGLTVERIYEDADYAGYHEDWERQTDWDVRPHEQLS